jgi:hypothetical protein
MRNAKNRQIFPFIVMLVASTSINGARAATYKCTYKKQTQTAYAINNGKPAGYKTTTDLENAIIPGSSSDDATNKLRDKLTKSNDNYNIVHLYELKCTPETPEKKAPVAATVKIHNETTAALDYPGQLQSQIKSNLGGGENAGASQNSNSNLGKTKSNSVTPTSGEQSSDPAHPDSSDPGL